jgi:DNA-binding NtrC family response regulator
MPHPQQKYEFLGVPAVFGSEPMQRVLEMVQKVAVSNAAILITGESGSGKEVVARAIHHFSARKAYSWIDLNCAAIPDNLLESELFGHEKGAFSGADSSKQGLFELANHGTLFLDEIGDLDPRLQVKLLRVLDGAAYYRLGGVKKVSVDVRLVTATNQDLANAIEKGRFRSDLYHRLSQIRIAVPPLRERRDDIIPLAKHYLALESKSPGNKHNDMWFSEKALQHLLEYSWPGNVRELRNVVVRAAILANGPEVNENDLPDDFLRNGFTASLNSLASISVGSGDGNGLNGMERSAILKALDMEGGHRQKAADRLGISKRTLQRRLKEYGAVLEPAEVVSLNS